MRHSKQLWLGAASLAASLAPAGPPALAAGHDFAAVTVGTGGPAIAPRAGYDRLVLTLSGTGGYQALQLEALERRDAELIARLVALERALSVPEP